MSRKIRFVTLNAIGIALFTVLSLCIQVPVFENYYLCLGYAAMAVYCYSFGTLSGTLVGFLGVILYCLVISGLRGMPGWALGNIVIGIALGCVFSVSAKLEKKSIKWAVYIITVIISVAVGILGVKSLTEMLLYSQPFALRVAKNVYAFIADTVVLAVSLPLCTQLHKYAKKLFPSLVKSR